MHTCTRAHVHTEGVQRCATECNGVQHMQPMHTCARVHRLHVLATQRTTLRFDFFELPTTFGEHLKCV